MIFTYLLNLYLPEERGKLNKYALEIDFIMIFLPYWLDTDEQSGCQREKVKSIYIPVTGKENPSIDKFLQKNIIGFDPTVYKMFFL